MIMQNLTEERKEKGFSTASKVTEPKVMRTIKLLILDFSTTLPLGASKISCCVAVYLLKSLYLTSCL